tara:strand:+ start:459 stop:863 length:405 start_codon:yes stop_codon:yes gene_type:complete
MNFLNQMGKYILYISIVLNGILLAVITGLMPFLIYLSTIINLVLFWYISKCLIRMNNIEEDIIYIFNKTEEFVNHLDSIYELEMYYGDEDLQNLFVHSRELINEYVDIQEKYFEAEVLVEEGTEDDSDTEKEEE